MSRIVCRPGATSRTFGSEFTTIEVVAMSPCTPPAIFIDSGGESGTAFLGEDWGKFTPIDDEMKLYLGVAQDVVVKRTIEKNEAFRVPS